MSLYLLSPTCSDDDIASTLRMGGYEIEAGASCRYRQDFYDSFDGRLLRRKASLSLVHTGSKATVEWRQNEQLLSAPYFDNALPQQAKALENQPYGAWAASWLGVRALEKQMSFGVKVSDFDIRDDLLKKVVVVKRYDYTLSGGAQKQPVLQLIELEALKGYEEEKQAVIALLIEHCITGLDQSVASLLVRHVDSAYPFDSKIISECNPHISISELGGALLQKLRKDIVANINGSYRDVDPEFVHDLRVAVRRTRSVLKELSPLLKAEVLELAKAQFKQIQASTSDARDMDVSLLDFPRLQQLLEPDWQRQLVPMNELLLERKRTVHRKLRAFLRSKTFQEWIECWERELDAGIFEPSKQQIAALDYSSARVLKRYRRIRKQGKKITGESEPEIFHEFRKSLKELRYSMEFFRCLYNSRQFTKLLERLKKALDDFGHFQDLETQMGQLNEYAHALYGKPGVTVDTILALGQLIDLFQQQHVAVQNDCLVQVGWIVSEKTALRYQRCFAIPDKAESD